MNTCAHTWIYIGSKRQNIWRCALCDEYRIDDPTQKREWQGLTDEEISRCEHHKVDGDYDYSFKQGARWAEAKLKEKNA